MKKISSRELINRYIDEFHLQQYMDTPLADIAELVVFDRDEYLIRVTEVSRYFYFLISGRVMCFSYANSERFGCVGYLQPVAMLGESASLWNELPYGQCKGPLRMYLYRHQFPALPAGPLERSAVSPERLSCPGLPYEQRWPGICPD